MDITSRFNSRAPRGARHKITYHGYTISRFQFTCPSRSTTDLAAALLLLCRVSIHVPLAEHDLWLTTILTFLVSFNSRAPRGARQVVLLVFIAISSFNSRAPRGARRGARSRGSPGHRFNSRAPRGARRSSAGTRPGLRGFNSRAPRGARLRRSRLSSTSTRFNSRAPRGARPVAGYILPAVDRFQFTCPSRSTTTYPRGRINLPWVSIHVPLAEHDESLI